MLYRYTLTFELDIDKYGNKVVNTLRDGIISMASLISDSPNIKIEDEESIQNNKKMAYKPIINTIDIAFDKDNPINSSVKYLLAYVKQIEAEGKQDSDFHHVLVTAINNMISQNIQDKNKEKGDNQDE